MNNMTGVENFKLFHLLLTISAISAIPLSGPDAPRPAAFWVEPSYLHPSNHRAEGYIIGGRPAEEGRWPWQGNMMKYRMEHCGCSLISSTWVITAAHCTADKLDAYSFQFGSVNRKRGGVTILPKRIVRHPQYLNGTGSYPNDLSLVELSEPAEGANITVIKMAATGNDHTGNADCWITGWGIHYPGPIPIFPPEVLYEVNIPVLSREECEKDWRNDQLSHDSVCVGDRNKKGSCSGDSGGPLVCKVNGEYELVGVASWGIVFCWPTVPSIYVGVGFHRDWIASVTGIAAQ